MFVPLSTQIRLACTRSGSPGERCLPRAAEGVAGAGLVSVRLKGKGDMVSVRIDPSLMNDDAEIVEDLIKAAHSDARKRLDEAMEKAMKDATQGLGGGMLPGFKLPF